MTADCNAIKLDHTHCAGDMVVDHTMSTTAPYGLSTFFGIEHCLDSFWRQANIKISWDLGILLLRRCSALSNCARSPFHSRFVCGSIESSLPEEYFIQFWRALWQPLSLLLVCWMISTSCIVFAQGELVKLMNIASYLFCEGNFQEDMGTTQILLYDALLPRFSLSQCLIICENGHNLKRPISLMNTGLSVPLLKEGWQMLSLS